MILASKHEAPRTDEEPQTNAKNACATSRSICNPPSSIFELEKPMNAANHSAQFRSLGRIRRIAGGVIMLLALTLAAPFGLAGRFTPTDQF